MKRVFLFFSVPLLSMLHSCNNADNNTAEAVLQNAGKDSANFTQVHWIDTIVDFGAVTKGKIVHIKYRCKNTGEKPMFIYYVRPGCGCTVANYTKAAIPPGGMGEVNAEFDSNHGIVGSVRKTIAVQTNTINPSPQLIFFGVVKAPQQAATADSTKKSS